MDAIEKTARELYNKYAKIWHSTTQDCKEQCIICCDEIISVLDEVSIAESGRTKIDYGQNFWEQVKEKIKSL